MDELNPTCSVEEIYPRVSKSSPLRMHALWMRCSIVANEKNGQVAPTVPRQSLQKPWVQSQYLPALYKIRWAADEAVLKK